MSASSKMVKLNFVGIIGSECWSLEVGWFCAFQKVIKNGLIVCSCASCYVCCVVFEEILCYHVFDMTRYLDDQAIFLWKINFQFRTPRSNGIQLVSIVSEQHCVVGQLHRYIFL